MRSFSRGPGYRYDLSGYFPPAIKTICLACIAVFTLQKMSEFAFGQAGALWWLKWFGLSADAVTHGWIWQLATYIFLHATILHILFNLLYLAMFGADLERAWGSKKFYSYFFLCGIGAGLINVIVKSLIFWGSDGGQVAQRAFALPTIGASGAIYGVLLAVAVVMPHRQVYLFPLPVTISMRLLVIVLGAIEFFGTIGSTGDNVSHICHLGGMLVGYVYLRRGSFGYNLRNSYSDWQRRRLKKKFEVYVRDQQDKPPSRPDNWLN